MSEKLGRPPVDDLSDLQWARVERGLWARMDGAGTVTGAAIGRDVPRREGRPWMWAAIPLAAAAAFAIVLFASRGTQAPPQVAAQEPTRSVSGDSPSSFSDADAHVTLDAHSAIEMEHGDKPVALLEYGGAWFSVAPRGDRPAFEVRAGDAIVRVVGTRFRVSRDGEHVDVKVDHGAVEVRFRGRVIALSDGQTWSSQPQPDIEMDPPAPVSHSVRRK